MPSSTVRFDGAQAQGNGILFPYVPEGRPLWTLTGIRARDRDRNPRKPTEIETRARSCVCVCELWFIELFWRVELCVCV